MDIKKIEKNVTAEISDEESDEEFKEIAKTSKFVDNCSKDADKIFDLETNLKVREENDIKSLIEELKKSGKILSKVEEGNIIKRIKGGEKKLLSDIYINKKLKSLQINILIQ